MSAHSVTRPSNLSRCARSASRRLASAISSRATIRRVLPRFPDASKRRWRPLTWSAPRKAAPARLHQAGFTLSAIARSISEARTSGDQPALVKALVSSGRSPGDGWGCPRRPLCGAFPTEPSLQLLRSLRGTVLSKCESEQSWMPNFPRLGSLDRRSSAPRAAPASHLKSPPRLAIN